jgi:hypothetical protein
MMQPIFIGRTLFLEGHEALPCTGEFIGRTLFVEGHEALPCTKPEKT